MKWSKDSLKQVGNSAEKMNSHMLNRTEIGIYILNYTQTLIQSESMTLRID